MAQLTWRNVDAPHFGGVTDALRLAGQSLTSGFSAARDALGDFQKATTQEESARALAATLGISDPAALKAAVAGFNPAYLSADALKQIAERPQDAATLDQTRASTANTRALTNQTNTLLPLKVEEAQLGNQSRALANSQTAWTNKNAQTEYAAKPAADALLLKIQTLNSSGRPEDREAARTLMMNPDTARTFSAAGVKDVGALVAAGNTAFTSGIKSRDEILSLGEKEKGLVIKNSVEQGILNLTNTYATQSAARRAVQEAPDLHPEVRAQLLDRVEKGANLWSAPSEIDTLIEGARPATAATPAQQPATPRAALDFQLAQSKAAGLTVTSGFRDANHPLTRANPNSAHAQARAWDLRAKTADEADSVMARQREVFKAQGLQEGRDYKFIDEVRNPSGHATGPHVHVQLTPEGQMRQGVATAMRGPQGPQRELGPRPATAPFATASANPVAQPAEPFTPGVDTSTHEGLMANARAAASAIQAVSDTNTIDSMFGTDAPLVAELTTRPNKDKTVAEVAAQLHKDIGDNNDGTIASARSLTKDVLTDELNRIMENHKGISPDMAGALLKSAVKTNFETFGPDARYVDQNKVSDYVSRFLSKDNKTVNTSLLNQVRQKAAIETKMTEAAAKLQEYQKEYLAERAREARGDPRANPKEARDRFDRAARILSSYAAKQAANPNVDANIRAKAGP